MKGQRDEWDWTVQYKIYKVNKMLKKIVSSEKLFFTEIKYTNLPFVNESGHIFI